MRLLALDTETYFDQEYSLRKLSTEEYVRDPRFKVHCHAFAIRNSAGEIETWYDATPDALHRLNWQDIACVAHHAQFDGLILSHHYGIKPKLWIDTYSMARAVLPRARHSLDALAEARGLPPKHVPYDEFRGKRDLSFELMAKLGSGCAHDAALCLQIYEWLKDYFPAEEYPVVDQTIRMFTEPTLVLDRERCENFYKDVVAKKAKALAGLEGVLEDFTSAARFADLLRAEGVEPPMKKTAKGNVAYAFAKTDPQMWELAEHENPTVQALVACRLGIKSTIDETRSKRLLAMDRRGPLAIYLYYCGAHTTRWSGGDRTNFQNLRRGGELRRSIVCPEGYEMVVGDLSQIEARFLNWLAEEWAICEAFASGRDIYSEGASEFYGRQITKADKNERHVGKVIELGCGYGMGPPKFQWTCAQGALGGPKISLDLSEAAQAVGVYRRGHPNVCRLWRDGERVLGTLHTLGRETWRCFNIDKGRLWLPNHLALDYTTLHYVGEDRAVRNREGNSVKIYGAKLVENVVQAASRVILSQAMSRIGKRYRCVWTVHDEIVCVVPTGEAEEASAFVEAEMTRTPAWADERLPLAAEVFHSNRYEK